MSRIDSKDSVKAVRAEGLHCNQSLCQSPQHRFDRSGQTAYSVPNTLSDPSHSRESSTSSVQLLDTPNNFLGVRHMLGDCYAMYM